MRTEAKPVDLLIAGGAVITMNPARQVLSDGAVAVAGSRIVEVGSRDALTAKHAEARRLIDARGKAILPGFVDVHAHAGHALVKSIGANGDEWMRLTGEIYARGADTDFWRVEAMLSGLERIHCGTTTACLLLGGGPDVMRTEDERAADAHLEVIESLGLREVLALGPGRPPFPQTYLDWDVGVRPLQVRVTAQRQLETTAALIDHWHGAADGRLGIAVSLPVTLDETWDDEARQLALQARRLSRDRGVLFVQDGHRQGSIAHADRYAGLPGPDAVFAHCIDLTEDDIAVLQRSGAKVSHNPSSLLSVRGRCPAPELMALGVAVGIGSDGPAPDRPFDMFRHMFQAMRYHARHFRDEAALPATRVLEMATIDGARVLGMEREIGSLEPGKRADLVVVDLTAPHMAPPGAAVRRLATFANGGDVETVVVNGRVLMDRRVIPGCDVAVAVSAAEAAAARALDRIGYRSDASAWS